MSAPIREQILAALLLRLRTAYGYARRDVPQYNDDNLPSVILWEGQELNDTSHYGFDNLTLTVIVDYANRVSPETLVSTAINTQLATIVDALQLSADKTLGGLITSIRYRNSNPDYPEPGRGVLGLRVTFDVDYKIQRGNPFSNV